MQTKWLPRLLYLLAGLIAVSAALSVFVLPHIYDRETPNWMAQAIAQDLFDMFVAVPALVVATILWRNGSRVGLFILLGTLLFIFYTYVLFCFDVHFNALFLVYCIIFGLTFYTMVWVLYRTTLVEVRSWFAERGDVTFQVILLFVFAALFCFLWLTQDLPALLGGTLPSELADVGVMTNPVHVMDYAFFLPGFCIAAVLFAKRHAIGYLFVPILLFFSVEMSLSIAVLILYMYFTGQPTSYTPAFAMLLAAIVQYHGFRRMVKSMRKA